MYRADTGCREMHYYFHDLRAGPRESGALDLGDGAIHRLQSERQEWHADLDSLLEGNFASEDLDLAITLAK